MKIPGEKISESIIPHLGKIELIYFFISLLIALLLLLLGRWLYKQTKKPIFIRFPQGVLGSVFLLIILKIFDMHFNDAAIRRQEFQHQAEIIAATKLPAAVQCDRLVNAARKVQDEDWTMASPAQLEWLIKAKDCREQLDASRKRRDNVKAAFETFEKDRSLHNATNIILALSRLTEFDKTIQPELGQTYEMPGKQIESHIGALKQVIREMDAVIHQYHQDGPAAARHLAALLDRYKKVKDQSGLEDITPLQPTIAKAYDIVREISKMGVTPKPPVPDNIPEAKQPASQPQSPRKVIFLDTAAIIDRNLEPLRSLLTEQFSQKGIKLSPFLDADIPRVAVQAPEDGRAIMKYPRDSDGNYQYAVSVNIRLLLPPKGKETMLGNIKKPGIGSTESEALRAAQKNVSIDVAEIVTNTIRLKEN